MSIFKKRVLLLLIVILPLFFSYEVKADEILKVENINQIFNAYNVEFNVFNNYEVSTKYEKLGDTLEFNILVKNTSSTKNIVLKDLTIVTDNTGVNYSATMDKQDLELVPNETRVIKIKGVLTDEANNGTKIVRIQVHYNLSDEACTNCNKPLDVIINPKTGDNINLKILLLLVCIICLLFVVIFIKTKNKKANTLLLILLLGIILPLYSVKADSDYMLEVIINQIINIKKIDDSIAIEEVVKTYTGNPVEGNFSNISNTEITPTYYSDEQCQSSINGKPINAGVYYATATSEGNKFYNQANLNCSKAVEITKADVTCPNISNITLTYDKNNHSLVIEDAINGGTLNYSLNNGEWTSEEIAVKEVGEYVIRTKIVGDNNHLDKDCGTNTITINEKVLPVDEITLTEVTEDYSGNPVEGIFNGNTEITPTYYEDNQCQNSINGNPINAGVYYATAISSGNEDYASGSLECTKAVTINKIDSICPIITDKTVEYDGENHSLEIGEGLSGGILNYSLENGEWTNTKVKVKDVGIYSIKTKVVGDNNHNNKTCGTNTITINKKNDLITVEEVTEDYTGYPIGGNFTSISNLLITPTYYDDDQCQNSITGKPINVGVYYATATSEGNDIYNVSSLSCSKAVTINKTSASCPEINDLTVTYDGESHSLEIGEGLSGGVLNYSLNNSEWSSEFPTLINPGSYVIKTMVVGDNNHENTFCKNNIITINKTNDTITSTLVESTYTGNPVEGNFSNLSNTEITPTYYSDEQCHNSINGIPVNAGDYYATASSEGNEIYKPTNLSCTKVVTINKAESVCPTIENVEVLYDGNTHSINVGSGLIGGILNYSIDEEAWTLINPTALNVGTYSIKTKVVGDNNHNDKNCGTNTITIKKIEDTITIEEVESTYTGNPVEGNFSNLSNTEITPTYYSDSSCNNSIDGKPRNPGIYYATATSEGNDIYKAANLSCTKIVTINKMDDTISVEEVESTYTGNPIEANISIISNLDINSTYYNDELCQNPIEGKPINTGVYYITATSGGNDYYNSSELVCTKAVTIGVAEPTCPVINDVISTYDGNSHTLNVGSGLSGGVMAYSINDGEYSGEIPSVENAGVYTINSKVIGDANHSDKICGTNTITIDQLGVMVMTSNQTKEYDGTPLVATSDCSFVGTYDGFSVSCINNGSITDVGETTKQIESVVIKKGDVDVSSNFIIAPSNGTLTITKTASICPTIQDVEVTYDENIHSIDIGSGLVGGTLNYKLDDGSWTETLPTVTNIGTYTIETKVVGDNNHNDTNCGSNTIKINKKTDTITSTLVETIYTGNSVEGNFSNLSNTEITPTYYSDNSCSHELNELPTNVGDYYATASSEGNNIYKEASLSCTKVVTITKAESVCPALGDLNIIYDGNAHSITVGSGLVGGTLNYKLDDGSWTETLPTVINVGVYSVKTKVVGDNNHNDKSCGTNTITIEEIPKLDDVISIESIESQYTGSPVLANFSNLSNTEITPTYYSDNSCSHNINGLPTNVGDYYATAVSEGNDDYNSAELSCSKAVTITKAPSICPTIQDVEVTYDENIHSIDIGSGLVGGTLNYKLDDGSWTETLPTVTNIGTYNIETKVVGDDNHTTTNCGSNTIKINKITDTITANVVESTYTGNPVEGNFSNLSNTEITPIYYSDSSCTNQLTDLPTNSGEYYSTATSQGNDIYTSASLVCSKSVVINKAASTCPNIEDVAVIYDGNIHSLIVGNGISGGTLYYSLNNGEYSINPIEVSDAGTYNITTKVVGDDNHLDETCGTNTILIAKKEVQVVTTNQTKEYDGTPLVATSDCSFNENIDDYTLACTNSGSITNAGEEPKVIESVTITNNNIDVTNNFNIDTVNGTLTVERLKTASIGECSETEYDGTEQTIISGGEHVIYSSNTGTNAGDYLVTVTTDQNHLFEDGTSVKTKTCSVTPRELIITPNEQDIKYGTEISKTTEDVSAEGLINGHFINSITLTQELTDVIDENDDFTYCNSNNSIEDDSCKGIVPSNAVIYSNDVDVTDNYNIIYYKGYLQIHYEITFTNGTNCESYDSIVDLYEKQLDISSYSNEPNSGYNFKGWKINNEYVSQYNEASYNPASITINGNKTIISDCVDDIEPNNLNLDVQRQDWSYGYGVGTSDFILKLTGYDDGSGISKIEWYYRKCGTEVYSKMQDTTFDPISYAEKTNNTNQCLTYGDYYAYVKVYDAVGNEATSEVINFTLDKPEPINISIDSNKIGTTCTTLKCSLDELFEYFNLY